jgi:hypothetical protein
VTIQALFFAGAHFAPSMDTLFPAGEITAKPAAVAKAFQGNAAVLATDAVVIADSFGVFAWHHSEKRVIKTSLGISRALLL